MKIIAALFLFFHGLIHLGFVTPAPDDPKYPFRTDQSWLLGASGKSVAIAIASLVVIGYALTALAAFGVPGLKEIWKPLLLGSTVASLILLGLWWHNWLILGVLIDLAIIAGVLWWGWSLAR